MAEIRKFILFFILALGTGCSEAIVDIKVRPGASQDNPSTPTTDPSFRLGLPAVKLTSNSFILHARVQPLAEITLSSASYKLKAEAVIK